MKKGVVYLTSGSNLTEGKTQGGQEEGPGGGRVQGTREKVSQRDFAINSEIECLQNVDVLNV